MHLGIDAREASSPERTGKGTWTAAVIRELGRRGETLTLFGDGEREGGALWHWDTAQALRRRTAPIDLYLSPTSYIVPRLVGKRFPCAVVVHDLIAFRSEPHDRKAKLIERLTLPKVLATAEHIFTVSAATKRELLERFPKTEERKITVVYEGPTIENQELRIMNQENLNSYFLIPNSPYILSIGTLCPRKNQLRLIEAFTLLPENIRKTTKLLLIGKRGWEDGEIVARAKKTPGVEWRGYVAESEREELLRNATVFAYPSLMEGFGLPVLDALASGIPTLTSDRSSLPEVAGAAALLVDPEDTEAIAEGLRKLLTDEALRKRLREEGPAQAAKFSWERTVDLLLGALAKKTHP